MNTLDNVASESSTDILYLRKTGDTSANMEISVCTLGNFLTAGRTSKVTIGIEDSDDIRELSAYLNHLKTENYSGILQIKFSEKQKYSMDQSVWPHIADALFAFSLAVDCTKLGL